MFMNFRFNFEVLIIASGVVETRLMACAPFGGGFSRKAGFMFCTNRVDGSVESC